LRHGGKLVWRSQDPPFALSLCTKYHLTDATEGQ
jgi:hypothetical protein